MGIAGQLLLHLFNGVHHSGVVLAAEGVTDARQTQIRALPHQIHPHLTGLADGTAAGAAEHLLSGDIKHLRHLVDHLLGCDLNTLSCRIEHRRHRLHRHRQTGDRSEGHRTGQGPLKLPYVRGEAPRQVVDQIPWQGHALLLRLLLKDRHAGLEIGGLDISDQSHLEPGDQALLQAGNLTGGPVTGDHHLFAGFMQGVEGVKELLLGVFLAFNELDVIHQQQICSAVAVPEGLHAVLADAVDQVIGEGFGGDVGDPG